MAKEIAKENVPLTHWEEWHARYKAHSRAIEDRIAELKQRQEKTTNPESAKRYVERITSLQNTLNEGRAHLMQVFGINNNPSTKSPSVLKLDEPPTSSRDRDYQP